MGQQLLILKLKDPSKLQLIAIGKIRYLIYIFSIVKNASLCVFVYIETDYMF